MDEYLEQVLRDAVEKKASDIHIKVGVPPYARIHGSLIRFGETPMKLEEVQRIVASIVSEQDLERARDRGEIDVAQTIPGVARFRCNVFKQRGTFEIVLRVVPYDIPSLDDLNLPPVLKHIAMESRGLVLVTGITGSGKSTTVAAMVQQINQNLSVHVVTIEDPIEFVYRDAKASVTQREVGIDTATFQDALKYVLRQDPDVIVLGEMRDRETALTAIMAAETGHLVFSTLHTADAVQTVNRIIDLFPADQGEQMRKSLAVTLKGIVSMRLIPKADGKGLVPAIEVMVNTPAIRSLLEEGKLSEIRSLIMEGASQYGMQTFDQSLLKLFKSNLITKEAALEEATSTAELEMAMRGITVGTLSTGSFMKGGDQEFYKQKAKEYLQRARRLFEQGLVEDASREIRRALTDFPEMPEAKELMDRIDKEIQKESASSKVEPFVKKGLELVTAERHDEAMVEFKKGLEVDPGNGRLRSLLRAAQEQGERVKGIRPLLERAAGLAAQGALGEARAILMQVLEKEPGHPEGLDRLAEVLQAQYRSWASGEMDAQSAAGEAAFSEKRWFDAISQWNLVREIMPEHPKAGTRMAEAVAHLRGMGVPGLPPVQQAPWAATITQAFEKGLTIMMSGHELGCINEWRTAIARAPQARDMLEAYGRKLEELHAIHMRYHVERARKLWEGGDIGHSMAQLRHALQLDPQAGDARALYDAQKPHADQSVRQYLADADQWEKSDRLNAAVFCLERAYEIDPSMEGLRGRLAEGRTRLTRRRENLAAMDGKRK